MHLNRPFLSLFKRLFWLVCVVACAIGSWAQIEIAAPPNPTSSDVSIHSTNRQSVVEKALTSVIYRDEKLLQHYSSGPVQQSIKARLAKSSQTLSDFRANPQKWIEEQPYEVRNFEEGARIEKLSSETRPGQHIGTNSSFGPVMRGHYAKMGPTMKAFGLDHETNAQLWDDLANARLSGDRTKLAKAEKNLADYLRTRLEAKTRRQYPTNMSLKDVIRENREQLHH